MILRLFNEIPEHSEKDNFEIKTNNLTRKMDNDSIRTNSQLYCHWPFINSMNCSTKVQNLSNYYNRCTNQWEVIDSIPRPDIESINFHKTCGEESSSFIKSCNNSYNDSHKCSKKLGKFTLNEKQPCPKIDNKRIISSSPAFKMFLSRYQTVPAPLIE